MIYPNLEIKEFMQAIANFCNQSELPAEIKRLCLKDLCSQLEVESNKSMMSELSARNQKEQEGEKG